MITTTTKKIDGRDFTVTVSDTYLIRKVGTNEVYSEAWDLPDSGFAYEETENQILLREGSKLVQTDHG